jgi:hypothetical protein
LYFVDINYYPTVVGVYRVLVCHLQAGELWAMVVLAVDVMPGVKDIVWMPTINFPHVYILNTA